MRYWERRLHVRLHHSQLHRHCYREQNDTEALVLKTHADSGATDLVFQRQERLKRTD